DRELADLPDRLHDLLERGGDLAPLRDLATDQELRIGIRSLEVRGQLRDRILREGASIGDEQRTPFAEERGRGEILRLPADPLVRVDLARADVAEQSERLLPKQEGVLAPKERDVRSLRPRHRSDST